MRKLCTNVQCNLPGNHTGPCSDDVIFTLVVTNADGSDPEPVGTLTLEQITAENEDDDYLLGRLESCNVGATVVSGGGSQPLYTFTRIQ